MNFLKVFLAGLLAVIVGSILTFFFWLFLLLGVAGSMSAETEAVKPHSILKIDFSETITDSPSTDPFAGIDIMTLETMPQISMLKTIRAIEAAANDDRIEGIYLRLNGDGGVEGMAQMEELRAALAEFRSSGKFVVSYNEYYYQANYYLASVADAVYLQPEGSMEWRGLAFGQMFFKGLFDKLGLEMEVFRPTTCKFKSAVEPYIMKEMSEANRTQMQEVMNSIWGTVVAAVSESRGIEVAKLNELADKLQVTLPEEALEQGFVDGLIYEDQIKEVFAELGATADSKGDYNFISLGGYASQVRPDTKNLSSPKVAVVYADGEIFDGEGSGSGVYGNSLASTLAGVRADKKVEAVVLRVNSPGGSALASDVVWREIQLLRAEKPVIVSMGAYAASGGYYISCPADAIVADRMTLTGSIGVFGMYLNTIDAMKNKLGVTIDGVKTNASADMGQMGRLTPVERASIMRGVDKVYDTFTRYVAEGRNLPIERVLDIAGGRVWSGADAAEIGLVDGHGGLKEAIAVAVDKAGLADGYRVVEIVDEPRGIGVILSSLSANIRTHFECSELGVMMKQYREVQAAARRQGLVMYCPYTLGSDL